MSDSLEFCKILLFAITCIAVRKWRYATTQRIWRIWQTFPNPIAIRTRVSLHFQPSLDSEDDFRSGRRNVSHRRKFPFRKQAMPFLTVDTILSNQAFLFIHCTNEGVVSMV